MPKNIVVGMDGSKQASAALEWAVAEAELHGGRATALLAWTLLDQFHADPLAPDFRPTYTAGDARDALSAWVAGAVGDPDAVDIEVVCDLPAHALLERAHQADLVVVGARGAGGFDGLLVGSVTDRLVERSTVPVAVVRTAAPVREGHVVVGVDGSSSSIEALRWAAGEAKARDAELEVVHAWDLPTMTGSTWVPVMEPTPADAEQCGREVLDEVLREPALEGLRVTGRLTSGSPARALLQRAAQSSLVVVGSRGHGPFARFLLGSVSRQVTHHAACPVVVV